jgi:hypothetical protein
MIHAECETGFMLCKGHVFTGDFYVLHQKLKHMLGKYLLHKYSQPSTTFSTLSKKYRTLFFELPERIGYKW